MNEKLFFCSVSALLELCCTLEEPVIDGRECDISESKITKSFESENVKSVLVSDDTVVISFTRLSIADVESFLPSRKAAKQITYSVYFSNGFIFLCKYCNKRAK